MTLRQRALADLTSEGCLDASLEVNLFTSLGLNNEKFSLADVNLVIYK